MIILEKISKYTIYFMCDFNVLQNAVQEEVMKRRAGSRAVSSFSTFPTVEYTKVCSLFWVFFKVNQLINLSFILSVFHDYKSFKFFFACSIVCFRLPKRRMPSSWAECASVHPTTAPPFPWWLIWRPSGESTTRWRRPWLAAPKSLQESESSWELLKFSVFL